MPPESEVKDLVDLDTLPIPRLEGHQWRQFGNRLVCNSCPNEHYQFLPPDMYFAGYNSDGTMLIKKRHVATNPVFPPSQGSLERTGNAPTSSSVSDD